MTDYIIKRRRLISRHTREQNAAYESKLTADERRVLYMRQWHEMREFVRREEGLELKDAE